MFDNDVSRRDFCKVALAIGGSGALSACVQRQGATEVPAGDPDDLPERQFAWNAYLPTGPHGNVKLPNHQLLLFLDYERDGPPVAADREQFETALRSLERAVQWGTGGEFEADSTQGLLFMVGYAPSYLDRFEESFRFGPTIPTAEEVIDELDEDATPDPYDAMMVLSSGDVQVLLRAELALRGEIDEINGVSMNATLDGVFEIADRRTGFLGVGRPAENLDAPVPEESPTAMGYRSGFKDNQATEDTVALTAGQLADGTLLHVSRLALDLDSWYDLDEPDRVHRMFSPDHTPSDVGEIGEHLGGQSRITQESANQTPEDAERRGIVGHTQKVAMARDEDFEPKILRRSEGVSTDLPGPSMNFISLQRRMEDFLEVRRAMNGESIDCPVHDEDDGIRSFLEVLRRGTYFVPPRSLRSFPAPDSE